MSERIDLLKCWLFGHVPNEDLRHSFCGGETEMTFCERCPTLFKEIDGEWHKVE